MPKRLLVPSYCFFIHLTTHGDVSREATFVLDMNQAGLGLGCHALVVQARGNKAQSLETKVKLGFSLLSTQAR